MKADSTIARDTGASLSGHAQTSATVGVIGVLEDIARGASRLIADHVLLAKLELERDSRAAGSQVARMFVLAPLLGVGYAFLCTALALTIGRVTGVTGGFAIVGGVNLAVGSVGIYAAVQRLKAQGLLETSAREARHTAATLTSAVGNTKPGVHDAS
jgi:hypothetical protein